MKRILLQVWLLILCSSTCFGLDSIDFTLVNGLIVVEAKLNSNTGKFIIDTGSPFLIINGKAKRKDMVIASLHSDLAAENTVVENFSIGTLNFNNSEAIKADMSFLEKLVGDKIDGIVGMDILKSYSFEIDFVKNTIHFYDVEQSEDIIAINSKSTRLNYLSYDDRPVIPIRIKNKCYSALLDSGANVSVFDKAFLKSLYSDQDASDIINQIAIGNARINDLPIVRGSLDNLSQSSDTSIVAILSIEDLNIKKLVCVPSKRQLIFHW